MSEEILVNERKIWWIASYPKSGNTWVRLFTNAYLSGFPIDINSAFQYVIGDLNLAIYQSCYNRPVTEITALEQFYIRPAALLASLTVSAAKHVCIKTHMGKALVDDIPLVPSKISAGGVYLIRDPRDVAVSFSHHIGETVDKTIECMNNMQYATRHEKSKLLHLLFTWSKHVNSWTIGNTDVPITVVRYEDMVAQPSKTFQAILKALGHDDIDMKRLKFAINETQFSRLKKLEDKKGFREKGKGSRFFRKGRPGQWKDILTERQVRRIEEDHGEVMQRYNYEPSLVTV